MRALALIVSACGAETGVHPLAAQVAASVEAGISDVRYDGFLASAAGSISPTIRWEHARGRGLVSARGTYLRFESGRHSLDGSANGAWFTPLTEHVRGELGLSAGSSQYANIASFSYSEAEARLHLMDGDRGLWVGATGGRSFLGGAARPVIVIATGVWVLRTDKTLFVSLDRSFVGDTAYTDVRSSGRWRTTGVMLEGIVGARIWSRGGGRGVFGEGSATVTISPEAALVISAGRYPTDAVSGSIAGRYVTAALRLGAMGVRRPPPRSSPSYDPAGGRFNSSPPFGKARLTIHVRQDDVVLTVHAPGATTIEVSGDFTDWQPIQLVRNPADPDCWDGTFRIASGVHRVNVRRDGGPWTVPEGTTRSADDYDGEVGLFTLP